MEVCPVRSAKRPFNTLSPSSWEWSESLVRPDETKALFYEQITGNIRDSPEAVVVMVM